MRRNENQSRDISVRIQAVMAVMLILFVYKQVREIPGWLNMKGATGGVVTIATANLFCPLPSHESGLRELANNSIVLADEKKSLISKLDPEH